VDGNLKKRIATAAVGIPLLAWLIGWSAQWLFSLVFFLLTVAALREYFAIIFPGDLWQQFRGIIFGSAVGLIVLVVPAPYAVFWLSLFLIILFASTLWSDGGPFLCVEPCWGLTDHHEQRAFEKKQGIQIIPPGGELRASFRMTPQFASCD